MENIIDIIYNHFLKKENKHWKDNGKEVLKIHDLNSFSIREKSENCISLGNSYGGIFKVSVTKEDINLSYDSSTEHGGFNTKYHNCLPINKISNIGGFAIAK